MQKISSTNPARFTPVLGTVCALARAMPPKWPEWFFRAQESNQGRGSDKAAPVTRVVYFYIVEVSNDNCPNLKQMAK